MNDQQAREWIDKYFAGTSSLWEEEQLRQYFQQPMHNIPSSLHQYAPLFQFFEKEKSVVFPKNIELPIANRGRTVIRRVVRIAATLLLLAAFWWMSPRNSNKTEPQVINWEAFEPDSPAEAFNISRSAFMRVANELNAGAKMATEEVNKVREISKSILKSK